MINWKDHKAALTGASRYLIKGIIQIVHSATSANLATEDCFEAFVGTIQSSTGYLGTIDPSDTGFISAINDSSTAFIGTVYANKGFSGIIDGSDNGFIGTITGSEGFEGKVCDD